MIRVHVVNSVKGGCGKSTWCLLLADYLVARGCYPYIIDLDLFGSSWLIDKEAFILEKKENIRTVNSLMRDTSPGLMSQYVTHLKIARKTLEDEKNRYMLPVYAADARYPMNQNEEQLEIFEYAVSKIMDSIVCASFCQGEQKDVDIILDMPPGSEPQAEIIVNHMLFDINSPWIKKIEDYSKLSENDYKTIFYMISGTAASGIELNTRYVKNLFHKKTYSSQIDNLLKKENILFVVNDLNRQLGEDSSVILSQLKVRFSKLFNNEACFIGLDYLDNLSELKMMDSDRNVLTEETISGFECKVKEFYKSRGFTDK